jgi:hypothetical protein
MNRGRLTRQPTDLKGRFWIDQTNPNQLPTLKGLNNGPVTPLSLWRYNIEETVVYA